MIDLSKPPDLEKIGWFAMGTLKFRIVTIIFIVFFFFGVEIYLFLDDYLMLGVALILSLLIFPILPIILVFLLNKYRVVERISDDWYHEK